MLFISNSPNGIGTNEGQQLDKIEFYTGDMHYRYILFSVLFQTKSSLVWKSYTQKLRLIFKPIPVWFGKKKIDLKDADSKPNSDWFGKFDDLTIVNALKIPNKIYFGLE